MTQYARPDAHHSNGIGNWDDGNWGDSNLHLEIDDTGGSDDELTLIQSEASMDTSADTAEFTLSDVDDPGGTTDYKLVYRALANAGFGGAPHLIVALFDSTVSTSTPIVTDTHETLGTEFETKTVTLSTSEANAISDFTALSVRVTRDETDMGASIQVTQVYFECPDASEEAAATSPAFLLFMD